MTLGHVAVRAPDGRFIFQNLSLSLGPGRTGLVGRNGSGKTTLLRLLAGQATPDAGTVAHTGTVGWLQQEPRLEPGETVEQLLGVHLGLERARRLVEGRGSAQDLDLVDWTLEARVRDALAEAGLDGVDFSREVETLSGGERTRVALARLFLDSPDVLLLDEPTNHMDADGRELLQDLVRRWPGAVVAASHDRTLLRDMDRTIELTADGLTVYGGGYDLFAAKKADETAAARQALDTAEHKAKQTARELQEIAERKRRRDRAGRRAALKGCEPKILLGAMAERAENSTGRLNRLGQRRREAVAVELEHARSSVERVRAPSISLPSSGLPSSRLVAALDEALWRAPDGRPVLGPLSLQLVGPERLAVRGRNGSGKSTLLRLLAGDLRPTSGSVGRHVRAVLLDQHASFLDPERSVLENWRSMSPDAGLNEAHAVLARFLFRNDQARRRVGELSGGERLRAALACVMTTAERPQLLLLDEPTNHLDLDAMAAVEAALDSWDGALVVVSHDEDFLRALQISRSIRLGSAPADDFAPATNGYRRG